MKPPAETVKWTVKASVVSLPFAAVLAGGGPLAAPLAAALVTLSLVLCWVLNDRARTDRLVKLIRAMRHTSRLPPVHRPGRLTLYGQSRRSVRTATAFPRGTMELEVTAARKGTSECPTCKAAGRQPGWES